MRRGHPIHTRPFSMSIWSTLTDLAASFGTHRRAPTDNADSVPPTSALPVRARDITSWIIAASKGDTGLLAELLLRDPRLLDVCTEPASVRQTAVSLTASGGHAAALSFLLRAGASAQGRNAFGMDPLMCAASAGHWSCVKLLLPRCDARRINSNGDTALMLAARQFSMHLDATLDDWQALAAASNPRTISKEGCTALILATRLGNPLAVEALLPLTPMNEAKDHEQGLRAWEWAWENKDWPMLDMMASHPASAQWRHEVIQRIENECFSAVNLPKSWAMEESRVLRAEINAASPDATDAKTPAMPETSLANPAQRAPRPARRV